MIKEKFDRLKTYSPFLGLSILYFSIILLIVFIFNYYLPNSVAWAGRVNPFYLLVRWDSFHYLDIAANGYTDNFVFFPLYPLLISAMMNFFPPVISGFFVSFLSLSIALFYLYRILIRSFQKEIAVRAVVLLLFFPAAMFFPLIYTESLFLALLSAFFYYAQEKYWITAAVIGFIAALTRNVGIFLWPVYLIFIFNLIESQNLKQKIIILSKKKEFWHSLLIPAGLFIFCLYAYWKTGDLLAFVHGQKNWSNLRSFAWPWQTMYGFIKIIFIKPFSQTGPFDFIRIAVIEFGSFLLLLSATIYWFVKRNWPYAVFCLFNVLLFSCMFPMYSVNRFVAVIFPIFIFLSVITKKASWLFYGLLAIFIIFFVFNVYLFSSGAWVG
jgi:Gpi18-like mannosyltransferase